MPLSLTRNVKFNHVLHERVLLVAVVLTESPRETDEDRVKVTVISDRIIGVSSGSASWKAWTCPRGSASLWRAGR